MSFPNWLKKLIDRVNADGDDGIPGIIDHLPLFQRAGKLVGQTGFIPAFEAFVAGCEKSALQPAKAASTRGLRVWMQDALSEFLGFAVKVPEPPKLNRRQTRAFRKYGFRLFFLPAIGEDRYPAHIIKPAWGKYLDVGQIERIPLPSRWVPVETIVKPDWSAGHYPDDRLMRDIGLSTRFGHPHSGKGEGDDIVEDILPKIAGKLGLPPESVMLLSAEEVNFLGTFWNWLRMNRGENLPDLGSTNSWEWVRNSFGSDLRLVVGARAHEGLACVHRRWHDGRHDGVGFRASAVL